MKGSFQEEVSGKEFSEVDVKGKDNFRGGSRGRLIAGGTSGKRSFSGVDIEGRIISGEMSG